MCGRFTLFTPEPEAEIGAILKEVARRLAEDGRPAAVDPGEICPSQLAPVLVAGDGAGRLGRLAAHAMVWGYPKYQGKGVVFNARAESAATKPMWADSLERRRCLVPSTGFFEWQHGGPNDKQKYRFNLPGTDKLYMAGIYKTFRAPDGTDWNHFSILTTEAAPSIAGVHSRMPVVLRPEEYDQWLHGDYTRLLDRGDILLNKAEEE